MTEIFPWEVLTQLTFDSGVEVWIRPAPPYVTTKVHTAYPPPPLPQVKIQSKAGSEEIQTALPGSPEHVEWRARRQEYDRDLNQFLMDFELDYQFVRWRYPGEELCVTGPPDSWVPDSVAERWGLKRPDDESSRRVRFIQECLIQTDGDSLQLDRSRMDKKPVTGREVISAMDPTKSPEEASQ